MKELKLEELTTRQKLGMCMTGILRYTMKENDPYEFDYHFMLDLIKNRSLGAIWLLPDNPHLQELVQIIKETADYPILIFTDAESGLGDYLIGRHNAIGCTDNEELAYAFGKVTAVTARKMGYNVVCNPLLDMVNCNAACGSTVRALGGNKYKVAKLAAAIARGMHDGGVLTVGKHYPSVTGDPDIDGHMAENLAMETKEELLDYNLYPYLQLMKEDLLDGIMTAHVRLPKIDPDFPTSLSEKVIGIIREQGFDGFAITDALIMMGVVAKFGSVLCKGMAIANGNDLALTWGYIKEDYESICYTYDQGLIPDARLDEATRRVLEAQHKVLSLPQNAEITPEDEQKIKAIDRDSTYAILDEGLTESISREGNHLFVVLAEQGTVKDEKGSLDVDTMSMRWYNPHAIIQKLGELFPNSEAFPINEFSDNKQNYLVLDKAVKHDDVIFITFIMSQAYAGMEGLTLRTRSLIKALQVTNKISTLVHFGNPFVLEEVDHIPRVLVAGTSSECVNGALEILAGLHPAKGVPTYDVKMK